MNERLPAHLEVAALRRLAEAEGGSAMVLAKGDSNRGSILLMLRERGVFSTLYAREMDFLGHYAWQAQGLPQGAEEAEISDFCAKRRRFDPDLWLIELDVPLVERFIVNADLKD